MQRIVMFVGIMLILVIHTIFESELMQIDFGIRLVAYCIYALLLGLLVDKVGKMEKEKK